MFTSLEVAEILDEGVDGSEVCYDLRVVYCD